MTKKKDPIQKALENPKSMRCAINAKCWDCNGCDADPAPRWRIANCPMTDCPLYPQRPFQKLYETPMPKCLRNTFDE